MEIYIYTYIYLKGKNRVFTILTRLKVNIWHGHYSLSHYELSKARILEVSLSALQERFPGFLMHNQSSSLNVGHLLCSSRWFHTALIILKQCGLWALSMTHMPAHFLSRHAFGTLTVCSGSLSYQKIKLLIIRFAWGIKIWQYISVFIIPAILAQSLIPQAKLEPMVIILISSFVMYMLKRISICTLQSS